MATAPGPRGTLHGTSGASFERVAHRGSPRNRTENTLPSFLLALEHGADAIELDVHVSRDGVVVVHHDQAVQGQAIAKTNWSDLSNIDLGGGSRIPRLQDVLDVVGERATVYIELKGRGIEDVVIDVSRRHGRQFALHSFDHECIARVAERAPDVARGVLIDRDVTMPAAVMQQAIEHTRARDVWPHWSLIDADLMRTAHELDTRVIGWTVNSQDVARRLLSLGVDGICSDDVRLLANL